MKTTFSLSLALALVAAPALADKKLDDAIAKADEQLQKGKPEEALKTLQKEVDKTPSTVAFAALARLQNRLGMCDEATASADRAVQMAAGAVGSVKGQAHAIRAVLALRCGAGKDALAHADEAAKADPGPATLAVLARAYARVGNAAKAAEIADKAVGAGATAVAHEARGEALLAQLKADDAAAAFRKALELDPRLSTARVGLAQALLGAGKAAEAVAEARKATEADAKSAEGFAVLGLAILAENPKSWNDAIAQAQQGAFLNPKSVTVQVAVAKIFEANNQFDQAQGAYRKAVEVDPGYAPAQAALIDVTIRKGELDAALAAAKKLAAEAPSSGEAQLRIGEVYLRKAQKAATPPEAQKLYEEAVPALAAAAKALPGSPEAHYYLGQALQFTGEIDRAVTAYAKAVQLAPNSLDFRSTYGLALGVAGREEEGVAELKKVTAAPGYKGLAAWANLGWVYRNMEPPRTEESIAAYKKALEIDPKNAQVHLGLGWAYSYTREWDLSIASFNKATELDKSLEAEAYNGIAWAQFFKRDMAQARAFAEKAKAKGRNVKQLESNIAKVENAMRAGQEAAVRAAVDAAQAVRREEFDIAGANQNLQSKNTGVRRKACTDLRKGGAEAAELICYAAQTDADMGVREACVGSITALGCKAKSCLGPLQKVLANPPNVSTNPTKEELQLEMMWGDLSRAIRDALAKLNQCR
jgi:superkiller protein 3